MNRKPIKIVLTEAYRQNAVDRLRSVGDVTLLPNCQPSTITQAIADCDALLVRTYSQVTRDVIESATRLKVIGRAGVGLDNIDVAFAHERSVQVVYTPAAATNAVAEHTIALMLGLERHLADGQAMLRDGRFAEARSQFVSRDLRNLTLGIIGMGRIGRLVAHIAHLGLGMNILYNDIGDIEPLSFPTEAVINKQDLYERSDVVTLHVPLTDQTLNLIDNESLKQFKPSATLINTCRGRVVKPADLAHALRTNMISGAALDVHPTEPPPDDYELLHAPNCLLTPHVASRTADGLDRMNDVVDDVIAVLQNRPPTYPAP
jgi:D-3-phosphoglycerate dehydrogenase / 2-oxoglutarate reductase